MQANDIGFVSCSEILEGTRAPKYAIAVGDRGLADSLRGAVTVFWFAVLTRRAFFMWLPVGNQYEWAFNHKFINWTLPAHLAAPEVLMLGSPSMDP
jgi:hypothetical protein